MRVVLVGYSGYWGKKLERVLNELGHTITSKIDRHNTQLLGDTEADAAIIATPPDTHYGLAMAAMKMGMDVLVEKPMAMRADHAAKMETYAKANGIVLSVDSTFCHSASFDYLSKLEEPLISYQSIRLAPIMPQAKITAGWDLVVHDLSILHRLNALSRDAGVGVEDGSVAHAAFILHSGGSAFIMASRCWPEKVRAITLHFPSGTYYWTLNNLSKDGDIIVVEREEPLKRLVQDFESRCRGRRLEGITDGLHGAEVVGCLERLFPPHTSIGDRASRMGNGLHRPVPGQHISV